MTGASRVPKYSSRLYRLMAGQRLQTFRAPIIRTYVVNLCTSRPLNTSAVRLIRIDPRFKTGDTCHIGTVEEIHRPHFVRFKDISRLRDLINPLMRDSKGIMSPINRAFAFFPLLEGGGMLRSILGLIVATRQELGKKPVRLA